MKHRLTLPWIVFIALAGLILGPLLAPGYILTLDLSWAPHMPTLAATSNTALLAWVLHGLALGLPSWIVEKILLLSIFSLAGVGMWRLAAERAPGWPAYGAGVMYVINPFTYERLMAGQWLVLAGYCVMPWLVWSAVQLLERGSWSRMLRLAGWLAALGLVSLHAVAMAVLVLLSIVVIHGVGSGRSARPAAGWLGLAAGLALVVSSFWLVPLLLHRSPAAAEVATFDSAQFTAFRTAADPAGAPLNVLVLQGFWGTRTGVVLAASSLGWRFWLPAGVVLVGVAWGLWVALRRRDRLGIALAVSAVVAAVLALGVATTPTAGLTAWLVAHVPFYRGYREPEKWVAVLALAYAYLLALGLRPAFARLEGFWRTGAGVMLVLVPALWVPLMPWGAAGQLVSAQYPAGWYALDAQLSRLQPVAPARADVLILPWHQYLELDFARRPVANPASGFFSRPVIISGDPELPGVLPTTTGVAAQVQADVIDRRYFSTTAGTQLAALGVHYVVLLKQADWQNYDWLQSQTGLTSITNTADYQLFSTSPAVTP